MPAYSPEPPLAPRFRGLIKSIFLAVSGFRCATGHYPPTSTHLAPRGLETQPLAERHAELMMKCSHQRLKTRGQLLLVKVTLELEYILKVCVCVCVL